MKNRYLAAGNPHVLETFVDMVTPEDDRMADEDYDQSGRGRAKRTEDAARDAMLRHTVQKGDTLSKMATRYYDDPMAFKRIYEANRDAIGSSPDKITEGQVLLVPGRRPGAPVGEAQRLSTEQALASEGTQPPNTNTMVAASLAEQGELDDQDVNKLLFDTSDRSYPPGVVEDMMMDMYDTLGPEALRASVMSAATRGFFGAPDELATPQAIADLVTNLVNRARAREGQDPLPPLEMGGGDTGLTVPATRKQDVNTEFDGDITNSFWGE